MYTIVKCNEQYYPIEMLGSTDDLVWAKSYRTRMKNKGINIGIHTRQ